MNVNTTILLPETSSTLLTKNCPQAVDQVAQESGYEWKSGSNSRTGSLSGMNEESIDYLGQPPSQVLWESSNNSIDTTPVHRKQLHPQKMKHKDRNTAEINNLMKSTHLLILKLSFQRYEVYDL